MDCLSHVKVPSHSSSFESQLNYCIWSALFLSHFHRLSLILLHSAISLLPSSVLPSSEDNLDNKDVYSTWIIVNKVKWSRYRHGVAQRVGRDIALLLHDRGTRRGWVVSSTPRPHFTPGKDPVPILQEAGWAPEPVCTGGKSRPNRDSIPDRPARIQSLYRLSYPAHPWIIVLSLFVCTDSAVPSVCSFPPKFKSVSIMLSVHHVFS